jgi:amidase
VSAPEVQEGAIVMEDLAFVPALEQATLVRRKEVTPVELAEVYLRRIERIDPGLGAYLTVAADHALESARAAQDALAGGEDLPQFHGVPISIKDLNDTAGIRTTHGTARWSARVPDRDDEVVARIRRAGFVILGKTVTPEFGPLNVSEPPAYPPGRNPWDPSRTCGGSSGGAASAVAAGLCPISQGSDGGGSIRNPSAWCGVYGLKPSRSRVSFAPGADSFFAINGPIARTVADAAALLDVMAGYVTGDAHVAPPPARPFVEESTEAPGRLRIAFHPHPGRDAADVAPAYRQAVLDTAELLAGLGHELVEASPPAFDEVLLNQAAMIFAGNFAARAPDLPDPDTFDPWNRMLLEMGKGVAAADYVRALTGLQTRARDVVAFFDDFDLLLTPTVGQPPPEIGALKNFDLTRIQFVFGLTPFTSMWNTTGQPAASVPVGFDGDGLPIGVQLVGRPWDEATVIRVSAQLETERPWSHVRPEL